MKRRLALTGSTAIVATLVIWLVGATVQAQLGDEEPGTAPPTGAVDLGIADETGDAENSEAVDHAKRVFNDAWGFVSFELNASTDDLVKVYGVYSDHRESIMTLAKDTSNDGTTIAGVLHPQVRDAFNELREAAKQYLTDEQVMKLDQWFNENMI